MSQTALLAYDFGLAPGCKVTIIAKQMFGTKFNVIDGMCPPDPNGTVPANSPYANDPRRANIEKMPNHAICKYNLRIVFTQLTGEYYRRNKENFDAVGVVIGTPIMASQLLGISKHVKFWNLSQLSVELTVQRTAHTGSIYNTMTFKFTDSTSSSLIWADSHCIDVPDNSKIYNFDEYTNVILGTSRYAKHAVPIRKLIMYLRKFPTNLLMDILDRFLLSGMKSIIVHGIGLSMSMFVTIMGHQAIFGTNGAITRVSKTMYPGTTHFFTVIAQNINSDPCHIVPMYISRTIPEWQPSPEWLMNWVGTLKLRGDSSNHEFRSALITACDMTSLDTYAPCEKTTTFEQCTNSKSIYYRAAHLVSPDAASRQIGSPSNWTSSHLTAAASWYVREICGDLVPINYGSTIGLYTTSYTLSSGWIASMIGSRTMTIDGVDVSASLDINNLHGTPLVIRKSADPGADDLLEDTKQAGIAEFRQIMEYGTSHPNASMYSLDPKTSLMLRHVPKSLSMLDNYFVSIKNNRCTFMDRVGMVIHEFDNELTLNVQYQEVPRFNCVKFITDNLPLFEGSKSAVVNRVINDSACELTTDEEYLLAAEMPWYNMSPSSSGNVICEKAVEMLGALVRSFTPHDRHRVLSVTRTAESTIDLNDDVYESSNRAVYQLMCAFAILMPAVVNRCNPTAFVITSGPVYWNVIKEIAATTSTEYHKWDSPINVRIVSVSGDSITCAFPKRYYTDMLSDKNVIVTEQSQLGRESKREVKVMIKHENVDGDRTYSETCYACDQPSSVMGECGHVFACGSCIIPRTCPVCEEVVTDPKHVMPADYFQVEFSADKKLSIVPSTIPRPFIWQQVAISKLTSHTQANELVWLPPGSGKTLIIISFIRWCIKHSQMPKYVLWCTLESAVGNLIEQCRNAGFRVNNITKRGSLLPGVINIVSTDSIKNLPPETKAILYATLFVFDEFHTCMGRGTDKHRVTMEFARLSYKTFEISGTVIKNSASSAELSPYLALCVDFQVTPQNYQVGLCLMISYRVPSRSVIRRETIEVPAVSTAQVGSRKIGEHTAPEVLARVISDAIEEVTVNEIGVVIAMPSVSEAKTMVDTLRGHGIRTMMIDPKNPPRLGVGVDTDPRGPGIIAASRESAAAAGIETLSWRLAQVVVTVIKDSYATGYNLNRYTQMFMIECATNVAVWEQMMHRIDRVDNNAPSIEFRIYYASTLVHIHKEHEKARGNASSIRDINETTEENRRVFDKSSSSAIGNICRATVAVLQLISVDGIDQQNCLKLACKLLGVLDTTSRAVMPAVLKMNIIKRKSTIANAKNMTSEEVAMCKQFLSIMERLEPFINDPSIFSQ